MVVGVVESGSSGAVGSGEPFISVAGVAVVAAVGVGMVIGGAGSGVPGAEEVRPAVKWAIIDPFSL